MVKKKHEPISYDSFIKLLRANEETVQNFENQIKATLVKEKFIGSVTGKLLDFFEEFDEEDWKKMVLTMIFIFGEKLGRVLGPEKEENPEPKKLKKKKGDNGQLKN